METLITEKFFACKDLIKFSEINELVLPLSSSARVVMNLFKLPQRILTKTTRKRLLIKESEPTNAPETLAIAVVLSPLSFLAGVVLQLLKFGGCKRVVWRPLEFCFEHRLVRG